MNNSSLIVRRYMARFGIILSNFAIISFLLMFGGFFAMILRVFFYLFMALTIIGLLGLPLLYPEFRDALSGKSAFEKVLVFFSSNIPMFAVITGILTASAILLMLCDLKWTKARDRLKIYVTVIIVGVVLLAISLITGIASTSKGGA